MKMHLSDYSPLIRRCLLLFLSYLFLGFLLEFYQVSKIIWIFTYVSIFYLSWSGTGAIALVLFFLFMIIGISFLQIGPGEWIKDSLNLHESSWFQYLSRQMLSLHIGFFKPTMMVILWIAMFVFIWFVGIGITFYHAFTQAFAEEKTNQRIIFFLVLTCLGCIGIQVGKLFVQYS